MTLTGVIGRIKMALTSDKDQAAKDAAERFALGPKIPFSDGYTEFKEQLLTQALTDSKLMRAFRAGAAIPPGFGARLDERIVEYPWVLARLSESKGLILDAGSTFNKPALLRTEFLKCRRILVYTLETDWITYDPRVSYIFGDLREMILRDGVAETIACISTLEHIGFTYEYQTYSKKKPWPHAQPHSYLDAIREFRRVLAPGGHLLLTVPFGAYEDHGWLQQFDAAMVERVKATFAGETCAETYYRYVDGGWTTSSAQDCASLSYFNIHETGAFEEDGLAAARAVCCLDLRIG